MKLARIPFFGLAALTMLAIPSSLFAAPPAAPQPTCKTYGAGKCCNPDVTLHLAKEAIFAACGESEATLIGEAGSTDTCKYHFKIPGEKSDDTFVQIYAPLVKEVPQTPTDPFMSFKKIGKVWVTDKAKSPKAAPILANATGLWLPGKGFFVSINASTKVCTKTEAISLAKSLK